MTASHPSQRPQRRECWLSPNRRALAIGLILPGILFLIGVVLISQQSTHLLQGVGTGFLILGGVLAFAMIRHLYLPRLAYQDGQLLVFLTRGNPLRVPVDVVECFFLGQTEENQSPGHEKRRAQTATVVVRLAEAAKEWHRFDVKAALGSWQNGYIIIRGTWCEPLSMDRVNALNTRLKEVKKSRAQPEILP
tara:strand:- start:2 stop:577 length:576 start_codon:yes stop_codon:yes gene_type:complete